MQPRYPSETRSIHTYIRVFSEDFAVLCYCVAGTVFYKMSVYTFKDDFSASFSKLKMFYDILVVYNSFFILQDYLDVPIIAVIL